ncbi:antitoxin component YwqK of YwqJK toxin-antitoxin module [Rufibacter quisquiliarum]|uniref:Antitoxin component YwqK of YwqJK toxin-antitoxin module n=1 Tax=Rufibacter quisquiliarum TaxID=1549639 RepID=A0A839GQU9_9BACT|nr:antitoxin component YwqK of YwqJK toxin-antitoxin module [Rufibacter quisquiliarum]
MSKDLYKQQGPTRYYYKNGQVKEGQLYTSAEVQISKWHENGQLYYRGVKRNGKPEGEAVGY